MVKVKKMEELVIVTEDMPGMLSEVSSAIAAKNVNISTICAYAMQDKARFMLITNNNKKAESAARAKGWEVKREEVVLLELPNKVGELKRVADKLKAKNINLEYCYGTTYSYAHACTIVLKSEDNAAIIKALK